MAIKFLNTVQVDTDVLYVDTTNNRVGIGTSSPGSVLDVQGTQGQLFSVTDDLSGEIFAVSDISGVPIMTVNSSGVSYFDGKVGIGTTSPDSLLEISTTDGTKNFVKLTSGAGGVNPALVFEKSAAEQGVIQYIRNGDLKIYNTDNDGGVMLSGSSATNYDMYINHSGNVGIGTTSPDYALHVDPVVKIGDRQGTDGSLIIQSQQGPNITFTSSGDALNISGSTGSSNGNSIRLQDEIKVFEFMPNIGGTIRINRGNRGLMDTNIGGYVVQSQETTASNGRSTFLSTDDDGTILRSTSYGGTGTSGDIQFQFGGGDNSSEPAPSTKMIIKNNGNVGIGTTSPGAKLHISESSSASTVNLLYLENTGSGGSEGVSIKFNPMFGATSMIASNREGANSGKTNLTFHNCLVNDTAPIERMRITSAGNVGIGTTSPNAYYANANDLVVGTHTGSNVISILSATDQTGWLIFADSTAGGDNTRGAVAYNHDNNSMTLRVNNNPCLVITSVGDVEIKDALLSNQENTDIDSAASEVVAQVSITDYTAAFFDFVVKKGTNIRSGTVYACHDGTNVEFTETSTNDLGDTSDVVLSVDLGSTTMRLLATVASDDWSVKSLIRAI